MKLTTVTPPAGEPVTLAEAKDHLRVTSDDEDTLIRSLITAARQRMELATWRAFMTQTLRLTLDCWPGCGRIELPRPPLQSVTSVQYTLEDESVNTFAASNYITDTDSEPGQVALKTTSTSWPSATLQAVNGIQVTYVAGYGDAEDVPQVLRQGILLIVGHYYENREDVVVGSGLTASRLPDASDLIVNLYKVR